MPQTNPKIMAVDDQTKPFAPSATGFCGRPTTISCPIRLNDDDLSTELEKQRKGFKKCTVCCGIITAIVLIIAVVMLVLGFTVFHVKDPKIRMNSATFVGLDQVNSSTTSQYANLTVVVDMTVKNPNVADYKFENSSSSLFYHGTVVGKAAIPGGVARARRTMRMNVTFLVMVSDIARRPEVGGDLMKGVLPVMSYTSIKGKVKILLMKRTVTVRMNCTVTVSVTSKAIVGQECKSHISI